MKITYKVKWRFVSAIFASLAIVVFSVFKWSIIDWITLFLYIPLAIVVWLIFLSTVIASITCITKWGEMGFYSLTPLAINVVVFLVVFLVPFTTLWLKANFTIYKNVREEIVDEIYKGELQPNVSHNSSLIALDKSYPRVSMGGNEIVVEEHEDKEYILFFTFRGVLDNYSGFIYVPEGGEPANYGDLHEKEVTQIVHWDGNWFYVSHQ
jgi:hypothetical protein